VNRPYPTLDYIRAFLAGGVPPAPPRDAATVALVRDGADGLEAYLLRRVRAMAFAGGAHVFPGGSVDPADRAAATDVAWAGPAPSWWATAFGTDEVTALALVCAAVRETFEEAGVLLAGPSADELVADVDDDGWEAERRALEAGEVSLSQVLSRRGLVLRADLLTPMAHWITPEPEPKRFDTRFFLAALPSGQSCRDVGGEADARLWVPVRRALDDGLTLMPPTRAMLTDLARFGDVASALAARRSISPVMPSLVLDGDRIRIQVPDPEA
jgi:8-oxo-dGTP pyrophosphatase MutT (NUDIX family)